MIAMEAHCWGSGPLDWAAAPLPVLLPVISIGSLVSNAQRQKERSGDLLLPQALTRHSTFSPSEKQRCVWLGCEEGTESLRAAPLICPATSLHRCVTDLHCQALATNTFLQPRASSKTYVSKCTQAVS